MNFKSYYKKYWRKEPDSPVDLFMYRFICKIINIAYLVKYWKELRATEKILARLASENSEQGLCVFVFANGPSLKDIDLKKISSLQKNNTHHVIAINSFLSKSSDELLPDYAVFADTDHFEGTNKKWKNAQYALDLEICRNRKIKTLVPAELFSRVDLDTKLPFCSIADIYGTNTKNICRPVGFYRLTALYALVLAKQLGYRKIYMAGFDNSYFKDFEVLSGGDLLVRHLHYYDSEVSDTLVPAIAGTTADIFFDFYKNFYYTQKITSDDPRIFNISKTTYLNTIPIDYTLDVYKEN